MLAKFLFIYTIHQKINPLKKPMWAEDRDTWKLALKRTVNTMNELYWGTTLAVNVKLLFYYCWLHLVRVKAIKEFVEKVKILRKR